MKKLKVGKKYYAHGFMDGQKITDAGFYHFEILRMTSAYSADLKRLVPIYLGLKTGVPVRANHDESQCFWFTNDGSWEYGGLRFQLIGTTKSNSDVYGSIDKPS